MRRTQTKSRVADSQTRHHVRIEGLPCAPGTHASRIAQARLIEALAEDLSLVACGGVPFEKLVIRHDGEYWIAEAEAVIDDEGPVDAPR